jgi:hypothetical protein
MFELITHKKEISLLTSENLRLKDEKSCLYELSKIKQKKIKSLEKKVREQNKEISKLKYLLKCEKSFG